MARHTLGLALGKPHLGFFTLVCTATVAAFGVMFHTIAVVPVLADAMSTELSPAERMTSG
jgi:hypothetical protein